MSFVKYCFDATEAHDFLDTFVQKCTGPACCCGCCSALRPRYKRLVDNIFPQNAQDGLVKLNMDKLTFYSLSCPEKLDRIGDYLFQKASRGISRRKHTQAVIAMEAMDQLLVACHSQTLNLFVESYLKMVQKLLESVDPPLQILATQSFVRFANIEEATPSYHRRYDFFVSKFSAMCHNNHADKETRQNIRLAGIQGLQGVIRKTVADDLVENIWEAQHMDKIVPSLLYNMQSAEKYETVSSLEQCPVSTPPREAESCLRELVGRAGFGHIRSVLGPLLTHFDRHELWVPTDFAVHTFKIIMFSIQAQYSYSVVEGLMHHLDAGVGSAGGGAVRAARATVLSNIVAIAAGDSVGPSVLEIINNLLTNLRTSVARDSAQKETDEKLYQEALINALGEYAEHLPDFQKIDIMMFIVRKVPHKSSAADLMLHSILLKSLLKVGSTYKTTEYSKAFPTDFLDSLLRMSSSGDPYSRVMLQRFLHSLLDRHNNVDTLSICTVNVTEMDLNIEKCSRQDLIFINKQSYAIYTSLYEGLQFETNTTENIESIYTTIGIIIVELASEETVCEMIQLLLAVQVSALNNPLLSRAQKYHLLSIVVALFCLITRVMTLPALRDYIHKIVEARQSDGSYLLPTLSDEYDDFPSPNKTPHLMIDQMAVCDCLKASGVDVSRLQSPAPYIQGGVGLMPHRHSWLETGATQGRDSLADITGGAYTELDSAHSSPGVQRKINNDFWLYYDDDDESSSVDSKPMSHTPVMQSLSECVSLEALRAAAAGPSEAQRREEERKRAVLNSTFRTAPFEHLLQITQPKYDLQEKLNEIFKSVAEGSSRSPTIKQPPYQKHFPELFLLDKLA